jgi:hypothetical protein
MHPNWLRRLGPLFPLRVILFTVLIVASTRTYGDPDLWGHVLFGGDIVRQRGVHHTDPYSFTSDRTWVNHEWLSEVVIYEAYAAAGGQGLVLLRVGAVCLVALLALLHLRQVRRDPVVHDASLALVVLGIWGQTYTVRPQLFSVVFFALLLTVLVASERQPKWLWAVPLLMTFWVNLHGGWLVGAASAGLWVLGSALRRQRNRRYLVTAVGVGTVSVIALLVNPYGYGMLTFLFETVGPSRPDIREWLPVYRLGAYITVLWLVPIAFVMFVVVRSRGCVSLPSLLVLVMLGLMTFRVARLLGFLAIASVLLLKEGLESLAERRAAKTTSRSEGPAWPWLVAAVVLAAGLLKGVQNSQCVELVPQLYPEPEAVQFIKSEGLTGKAITYFDWGQYAIWHLHPWVKVSIDGRRETVYSEEVLGAHRGLSLGESRALQFFNDRRPDFVWLPRGNLGIALLLRNGWTTAFDGPKSVILVGRPGADAPPTAISMKEGTKKGVRCFPAP